MPVAYPLPEPPTVPPAGPVFDPDTGELDKAALRAFIDTLVSSLPKVEGSSAVYRDKLKAKLEAIVPALEKSTPLSPEEQRDPRVLRDQGMLVRDAFAAAAERSSDLAKRLKKRGDNSQADAFGTFSAAFEALKQIHLTGTAQHAVEVYAGKEVDNIDATAPGVTRQTAGSSFATNHSLNVGYGIGVGYVGAGGRTGRNMTVDENGIDVDFWTNHGGHVEGGAGWKFGNWQAKVSARLGMNKSPKGQFYELDKTKDVVKLVTVLDANRSTQHSAGPKVRKATAAIERTWDSVAKNVFGRGYRPTPGVPTYLKDEKIAKGATSAKLHHIGAALDQVLDGLGPRGRRGPSDPVVERAVISDLFKTAYPSMEDQVQARFAAGQPLPHSRLHAVVPHVVLTGQYVQESATLAATIGQVTGDDPLEAQLGFSAGIRQDRLQFKLDRSVAAHGVLDTAATKDIEQTLLMHSRIDALPASEQPPRLYLYNQVKRELGGAPDAPAAMNPSDLAYFGAEAGISAQFKESIAHPTPEKLQKVSQTCQELARTYLGFVKHANVFADLKADSKTKSSRHLADSMATKRLEAFREIDAQLWQSDVFGGGFPGGLKAAQKDPERFIAESHEAISLALGNAGTHLSILKRQMATRPELRTDDNKELILQADASYKQLRDLLDHAPLPIRKQRLLEHTLFKTEGLGKRYLSTVNVSAKAGAAGSVLKAITNRFNKSTGDFSLTQDAGAASLRGKAVYQIQDSHANASRVGSFLEFTVGASGGGPVLGTALCAGVLKVMEKTFPGTQAERIDSRTRDVRQQLQGLVLDVGNGANVVVKLRKAPGAETFDLQYVRTLATKTSGVDASMPIVTPIGQIDLGVNYSDATLNNVLQVHGPDLSNLIMHHPTLKAVMAKTGGEDQPTLRALLKDEAHRSVMNGYFGGPDVIATMVQRYAVYENAAREAAESGTPLIAGPQCNEFFRYHEKEPFKRAVEVAAQSAQHAPGATAANPDQPGDPFAAAARLPNVPAFDEDFDWDAAQSRLKTLKSATERMDYYCGEGRPILDRFVAIMDRMVDINSAVRIHAHRRDSGYYTEFRDASLRAKPERPRSQSAPPARTVNQRHDGRDSSPDPSPLIRQPRSRTSNG